MFPSRGKQLVREPRKAKLLQVRRENREGARKGHPAAAADEAAPGYVRASHSAANSDRSDFKIKFYQASRQDCLYEIGVIVQFRLIKDLEIPSGPVFLQ